MLARQIGCSGLRLDLRITTRSLCSAGYRKPQRVCLRCSRPTAEHELSYEVKRVSLSFKPGDLQGSQRIPENLNASASVQLCFLPCSVTSGS